jgi:putative transposase
MKRPPSRNHSSTRNRTIERPGQVWETHITYIPMSRGFVYLAAVLDWATPRVLCWRL